MARTITAQCTDCRDHFTIDAAIEHSVPGTCVEWSNHAMFEATFTIAETDTDTVHIHTRG
jgi:hypothetical protein